MAADARIVNLETAITRSEEFVRRAWALHEPRANADCLAATKIDCCTLANNQRDGARRLLDTLSRRFDRAHIKTAGAGPRQQMLDIVRRGASGAPRAF